MNVSHGPLKIYVSLPYEPEYEDVYKKSLLRLKAHIPNLNIRLLRLDKEAFLRPNIGSKVENNIETSHIYLADISAYQEVMPNINMFYEIGLARGRSIPRILIGEEGSHHYLPSNMDMDGVSVVEYDRNTDVNFEQFSKNLSETINSIFQDQLISRLLGDHSVVCFKSRERVGLPRLIEGAKSYIGIITTNLQYIQLHLMDSLRIAIDNNKDNPEFTIDLITMDPESEVTNGRAEQLSRSLRRFRQDLRDSLDKIVEIYGDHPKVQIFTYRTLPTQVTYIIDNVVVTGVVSLGQQSRRGIHFMIENEPDLQREFHSHARALKNISTRHGRD